MKKWILTIVPCLSILCFMAQAQAGLPTVDCDRGTFNSGESKDYLNVVSKGAMMIWFLKGPQGTVVDFEYADKDHGGDHGKKENPFIDGKPAFDCVIGQNGQACPRGPVRQDAEGMYGYKITCTWPDKTKKKIDPIIEIPK